MHSFNAIPAFIAVVESGSYSLAANKIGVTKSALSKRINQLEDQLGTRLLNRTTRTLSLTEAGQRYFDYVSQAYSLAQQGVDAVSELQGLPQGKLKITLPMSFGINHIAPFIAEFLNQYPKIEIDLQLEDQMVDLVAGGYDLAIRIGHLPDSSLVAKRLVTCRSVLCASPDYLANHLAPIVPLDLTQHNCLQYTYFKGGNEWTFEKSKRQYKVLPKGRFSVNNSEAIRQALLSGLGIGQLPTFLAARDLKSGHLIPLMQDYQLPVHAAYAVFPQRKHLPSKVSVFIDFISSKLGGDIAYWDKELGM
ncbi:LysR family transcriptional regulator [Vibrio sonorensis]|uniref:LysR family transcriptional regulator n=1 Tax=Vibrio sonorensis TaxID=1004316 RepID=UPI0008D917BA|nr:LysR family transcriptional regulator [Vibrio sonorensis]